MFIHLTSASTEFNNKPLALNTDVIVSMIMDDVTNPDGSIDRKTFIFCPPYGTWEVRESVDEILAMINIANK